MQLFIDFFQIYLLQFYHFAWFHSHVNDMKTSFSLKTPQMLLNVVIWEYFTTLCIIGRQTLSKYMSKRKIRFHRINILYRWFSLIISNDMWGKNPITVNYIFTFYFRRITSFVVCNFVCDVGRLGCWMPNLIETILNIGHVYSLV